MSLPVLWLRPFEQPVDREQLRRRAFAAGGLWFFLAGLLAALGFGAVLIVSFGVLLAGGLLAGGLWFVRRFPVREGLRAARLSMERALRRLVARVDELGLQHHLRRSARRSWRTASSAARRGRLSVAAQVGRLRARTSHRRRQALRLNELGAQLRRDGEHEQAAEQHRAALVIVRELGDEHAEALTLNNLALALAQTDGVGAAVQHLEQALVVFRRLGDLEHEGRVMANLGFVHRRQGRDEYAENLLHAALDKLPPESPAYRQVEEQLQRAS